MRLRKSQIAVFAIVIISFLVGACFYSFLPEKMASHWNAKGQVDSYMPRFCGAFFLPIILTGSVFLYWFIPVIAPNKSNIERFRKYYDGFVIVFSLFMFGIYLWSLLWNVGVKVSSNVIMPAGVGLLIFYSGILCENAKRNFFIGIRTPWTLSDDRVWDKTHKIGGLLFKASGVVVFAGCLFPEYAIYFVLVPVILTSIFSVVYSYFEYRKLNGKGDRNSP